MVRTLRYLCVVALALLAHGCAGRSRPDTSSSATPESLSCDDGSPQVTWELSPILSERAVLDSWCNSVGPPVVLQGRTPDVPTRRLQVVSWNIHVGGGRVKELLQTLASDERTRLSDGLGTVLLLQEAFREGGTIPAAAPARLAVPGAIRPQRPTDDVVGLARALGYWLAYVPSMRNGPGSTLEEREDRGVAILSSEPIDEVIAIELPFARQRRIALLATIHPHGGALSLRMGVGHFDALGGSRQATRLADYLTANAPGPSFIWGIDTNATFGARSGSVRALERIVPRVTQCGTGPTSSWVARVDFMFSNIAPWRIARCDTLSRRYGSDHLPSVAALDLQ